MRHSIRWNEEAGAVMAELIGSVSTDDIKEIIAEVEDLFYREPYHYLVVDLARSTASIPSDNSYRQWLKEEYYRIGFDRIAIVHAPFGLRMMVSLAGRSHIQCFSSLREAVNWMV